MRSRVFLCLLLPAYIWAAAPNAEQSINFQTPQGPKISADGRFVAYEISKANWEENAFETQIWIAAARAPYKPLQLTNSKKSSGNPEWSPDSKWLAFLSDRDGKRQLYVILAAGGEARRVSDSETPVNSFHWAPDGKALAYIAAEPDSKALKDRKEKYGEFEIVHQDYAQNRLWLQPLDGKATVITSNAPFSVSDFDWSPDGKQITFSAVDNPSPGSSGSSLVYVMDIAGKSWKKLSEQKGPERNPKWSPDGKQIVYQTAAGEEFYYFLNDKLAVIPATGGTPHRLADDFDEDKQLIAWSRAGIYFEAAQKTASYLFVIDPSSGAVKRVGENDSLFNTSFSVTPEARRQHLYGLPPQPSPKCLYRRPADMLPRPSQLSAIRSKHTRWPIEKWSVGSQKTAQRSKGCS
jgi:Tol biopolymer transport system component